MIYDDDQDKVQLNICLPRYFRGKLRKIAAERMVEDPDKVESAASVGAEIIRNYLDEQEKKTAKK
jgi:hypothetical protein